MLEKGRECREKNSGKNEERDTGRERERSGVGGGLFTRSTHRLGDDRSNCWFPGSKTGSPLSISFSFVAYKNVLRFSFP